MRQADLITVTLASLFTVWLVRTGRTGRISSGPGQVAAGGIGPLSGIPGIPAGIVSSQQAQAIAARARTSIGASTSTFNPQYPRRACASYVSSVLVSLGLLDARDARCTGLQAKLPGAGAEKVASGPAGLTPTKVGDIVFFRDAAGIIRHVEIAGGPLTSIGTSSSQQTVGERPISRRGFPTIDVWRY